MTYHYQFELHIDVNIPLEFASQFVGKEVSIKGDAQYGTADIKVSKELTTKELENLRHIMQVEYDKIEVKGKSITIEVRKGKLVGIKADVELRDGKFVEVPEQ